MVQTCFASEIELTLCRQRNGKISKFRYKQEVLYLPMKVFVALLNIKWISASQLRRKGVELRIGKKCQTAVCCLVENVKVCYTFYPEET